MNILKYCWLCEDCLFVFVTREAFDEVRGPRAPTYRIGSIERLRFVESAADAFEGSLLPDFKDRMFSRLECDCCHSKAWGERYRFAQLAHEPSQNCFEFEFDTLPCTMSFEDVVRDIREKARGNGESDAADEPATLRYKGKGKVRRALRVDTPTARYHLPSRRVIQRIDGDTPTGF